jgi:enoyl-[acyl-carrier-protein] reductase (NADH)
MSNSFGFGGTNAWSRSSARKWSSRPMSTDEASLDRLFETLKNEWGRLDFVVHAIAFSDKDELKGRYVDTTKANFQRSLTISCYSFTEIARARCR